MKIKKGWAWFRCKIGWHNVEQIGFTALCNPAWRCRRCGRKWVDYFYATVYWDEKDERAVDDYDTD